MEPIHLVNSLLLTPNESMGQMLNLDKAAIDTHRICTMVMKQQSYSKLLIVSTEKPWNHHSLDLEKQL